MDKPRRRYASPAGSIFAVCHRTSGLAMHQQAVDTRTSIAASRRYPHSIFLLEEAAGVLGSLNAVARHMGAPWSTVANIHIDKMALPSAMVVALAELLAREPMIELAKVELERTDAWQQTWWRRKLRRLELNAP